MQNINLVNQLCDILDELRPRSDKRKYKEQIAFVPDRLGHDRRYAIDDTFAENELGFTRKYSFDSGLRATVEWYLTNDAWCKAVTSSRKAA